MRARGERNIILLTMSARETEVEYTAIVCAQHNRPSVAYYYYNY